MLCKLPLLFAVVLLFWISVQPGVVVVEGQSASSECWCTEVIDVGGGRHACRKHECENTVHLNTGDCFGVEDTVLLESGERRRMKELQIGDRVQTIIWDRKLRSYRPGFSPVYAFLHRDPDHLGTDFLKIGLGGSEAAAGDGAGTTEAQNPPDDEKMLRSVLTISRSHLLFCVPGWDAAESGHPDPSFRDSKTCYAGNLKIGDFVFQQTATGDHPLPRRVTSLESGVMQRGAYAPATLDGTIVVSEIVASVYAVLPNQALVHSIFWPLRFWTEYIDDGILSSAWAGLLLPWTSGEREEMKSEIHPYALFLEALTAPVLPMIAQQFIS